MTEAETQILEDICEDKYVGYEKAGARRMLQALPRGYMDMADALAEMRVAALGAARSYDADRGTAFATWLVGSLRLCSMGWCKYAWYKKNHPVDRAIITFSAFSEDGSRSAEELIADSYAVGAALEAQELVRALSATSRKIFKRVLKVSDEAVRKALSVGAHERVAKVVGVTGPAVAAMVKEVRTLETKYMGQ